MAFQQACKTKGQEKKKELSVWKTVCYQSLVTYKYNSDIVVEHEGTKRSSESSESREDCPITERLAVQVQLYPTRSMILVGGDQRVVTCRLAAHLSLRLSDDGRIYTCIPPPVWIVVLNHTGYNLKCLKLNCNPFSVFFYSCDYYSYDYSCLVNLNSCRTEARKNRYSRALGIFGRLF